NMSLDDLFYKLKQRHPRIIEHIWQTLVNAKCISPATSITLCQLRAGYYDITEEHFPRMGDPRTEMLFLLSIPFIASYSNRVGTFRFYIIDDPEK
ncbi:hypothetical protein KR093_004726, partial [Drosophila rubida]